jgi:hypothetical protein
MVAEHIEVSRKHLSRVASSYIAHVSVLKKQNWIHDGCILVMVLYHHLTYPISVWCNVQGEADDLGVSCPLFMKSDE